MSFEHRPVLLAPTKDVVPIGVEHSSLQASLDAAAKDVGVALSPDPFPEETVFVRSDQYAFVRAGVPAVYLMGGVVGLNYLLQDVGPGYFGQRNTVKSYRALAGPDAVFVEPEQLVQAQRAADVLLADTTSVVSEFVVQRKPVVTFRNRAPKPHMLDFDDPAQLPDLLSQAFDPPAPLRAAIAAYADAIHPWRDGRSSERVIDATEALLVRGLDSLARKPLGAWWRALQIRRELGYLRP